MNEHKFELIQTLNELDNFSEASDALSELSDLDAQKAKKYALDILKNKKGDVQLQAHSLEILYAIEKSQAYEFILENGAVTDPYIFKSMLELITEDSSLADESPGLLDVARFLSAELVKFDDASLARIGNTVDWFQDSYKDLI
jgi:hypothetical protein